MGEKYKKKTEARKRIWNQRGFTLVELLATIVILGILIAIAVPAIGSMLEKSSASADESSIALMEKAGENAYVDDQIDFDGPEPESYTIPKLIEEGYLKLDDDHKFNQPENYVTKKNIGGEFIWMGDGTEGETGEPGGTDFGLIDDITPIATCEEAITEGYDVCIETPAELQAVESESTLRYIVMNDLDLSGMDWYPIGGSYSPFTSELNGNGYTIHNLSDSLFVFNVGLVQNLLIEDAAIVSTHDQTGVLAGSATDESRVKNVCARGTVESAGDRTGGLIGENHGIVEQSCADVAVSSEGNYTGGLIGFGGPMEGRHNYASGDVEGAAYTGGFIGNSQYEIEDAYATGNVTGTAGYAGGFAGDNNGGIVGNVYATGDVTATADTVGGLVGRSNLPIANSWASGTVTTAGVNVGGLIGENYGPLEDVYATGLVKGGGITGGLVGVNSADLSNGYATGEVTGTGDNVGGLIGTNNSNVTGDSYATGSVTGHSDAVGGFAGLNGGQIEGAVASGDVSGGSNVGGIVGLSYGDVNAVSATGHVFSTGDNVGGIAGFTYGGLDGVAYTGKVTGERDYAGGLVGQAYGSISNSYAVADVAAAGNAAGGLIGGANSPIYTSFASGQVSAGSNPGSLYGLYVGGDSMDVVDSYWNTDFAGTSALGVGATTAELQQRATYTGFDFDTIWSIQDGVSFPVLQP